MSNLRTPEILRAASWPELVGKYRHARLEGRAVMGMDAISNVAVALIAIMILTYLAFTSKDGLSAFVGGVIVGGLGGALFWSYPGGRSGTDAASKD